MTSDDWLQGVTIFYFGLSHPVLYVLASTGGMLSLVSCMGFVGILSENRPMLMLHIGFVSFITIILAIAAGVVVQEQELLLNQWTNTTLWSDLEHTNNTSPLLAGGLHRLACECSCRQLHLY